MADDADDDIRGDIATAMKELAGEAVERPEVDAAEKPDASEKPPASGRARDESGRFAKGDSEKPRETLVLKEKPTDATTAPAAPSTSASAAAPPTAEQPKPEPIAPPAEWKGAGKIKWDRLPREVQGELRAMHDALASERAEVAPLREMIEANRQTLVREAGSVQEGFRQLLAFHQLSLEKPLDLIHHIARARGIDLRAALGGQPGPQPGTQQQPADIQSQVAHLVQQALQPYQQQVQQRENQQLTQTIEAFRADPQHPYFEDVRAHMGHLLQTGVAKDLQDAYDQATWANPTIRQQLMAAQAEEAKKVQAAEAEKARRAASASLRGSPISGAVAAGAGNSTSTVHDDVRAAMAELSGA